MLQVALALLALLPAGLGQREAESALSMQHTAYPVRLGYVDKVYTYTPPEKFAGAIGVPGFSDEKIYNHIALTYWQCGDAPTGVAFIWNSPTDFFTSAVFGRTKQEIQANLHRRYADGRVKLLVSAFGPKENPASEGYFSGAECAERLAVFVGENQLDGVEVNWQDSRSFERGTGEDWLVAFQLRLRKLLPSSVIVHSPMARHWQGSAYPRGGYLTVHQEAGAGINFYNVAYYNQGSARYDSYDELFLRSTAAPGTAVLELASQGVDPRKIVVGKPIIPSEATSGWVSSEVLGAAVSRAYEEHRWFGGVGLWQYGSEVRGKAMTTAAGHLKEQCALNKDCK